MDKSILDKLKLREELEKRILKDYEDILYRIFQIIYEVDAEVSWERIYRFSDKSNFIMISGSAILPKGNALPSGKKTEEIINFVPSFTMPWQLLDDNSTAYEIAEAAKDIKMFGELVGGKHFIDLLRSDSFNYEQLKADMPDFETLDEQIKENKTSRENPEVAMEEITQTQVRNMLLEDKPSE